MNPFIAPLIALFGRSPQSSEPSAIRLADLHGVLMLVDPDMSADTSDGRGVSALALRSIAAKLNSIELKGVSLKAAMHIPVACGAKRDQVLLGIIAALAAKFLVVNLQVRPGAAALAPPAVTPQYLFPELFVQLGIKPHSRLFGPNPVHEAFSVTSCRKACRCSPGRNLKNRDMDCRSTVGSSLSEIRSCQEVRADHLQTVAPRLVRSQHQSCRLNRLLDDRNLGLVQLEVDNLPRFRLPPG